MISKFHTVKVVSDEFSWNVDANFKYAKEGESENISHAQQQHLVVTITTITDVYKVDGISK